MVGAVLNGGSSSRMGADKAMLELDGQTFLERAVENAASVADRVIVVGGPVAPDGSSLAPDLIDGAGPLGGLASALRHADGADVLCLAVDLPLVSEQTLRRIAEPGLLQGQARVARTADRLHPLCGAYSGDLVGLAWELLDSEDRSLMGFLRSVPHLTLVDVPDHELANVNTGTDLEAVLATIRVPGDVRRRA